MFFQMIIYVILIVGFCFGLWKLIIKPMLEGYGVEVEDEKPDPLTAMEMKSERLQRKLENLKKDADAAQEISEVTQEIMNLEEQIAELKKSS